MELIGFFIAKVHEAFQGVAWFRIYLFLKYFFIALSALLAVWFIFVLPKAWGFRPRFTFDYKPKKRALPGETKELARIWDNLKKKAFSNPPQTLIDAVVEADDLTDRILRDLGIRGVHMADRLEELDTEELKTAQKIWRAHQVKNNIINTPGFVPSDAELRHTLDSYEDFLKELGII